MAYVAKDGKKFGNIEHGRHYDATRPGTEKTKVAEQDKGAEEPDMKDVVAEHGPAEHMEMHSHHADGHVHKATHHDSHSAHEHVDKAFDEGEESEGMHEHEDGEEAKAPAMGLPGIE